MEGMRYMLEQVEFINANVVRCLKDACWLGPPDRQRVPASTVLMLLRRYREAPVLSPQGPSKEAQHADILTTRCWMRHKIWSLGFRHGYITAARSEPELRPSYALVIAGDTITACSKFKIASLETCGVGLVSFQHLKSVSGWAQSDGLTGAQIEKISDIATGALQMVINHRADINELGPSAAPGPQVT